VNSSESKEIEKKEIEKKDKEVLESNEIKNPKILSHHTRRRSEYSVPRPAGNFTVITRSKSTKNT